MEEVKEELIEIISNKKRIAGNLKCVDAHFMKCGIRGTCDTKIALFSPPFYCTVNCNMLVNIKGLSLVVVVVVILLVTNSLAFDSLNCGCFNINYSCNVEQPLMNLDYASVIGCKCDDRLGTALKNLIYNYPAMYPDSPTSTCSSMKQKVSVGSDDHVQACKLRDETFLRNLCEILKATSFDCRPQWI